MSSPKTTKTTPPATETPEELRCELRQAHVVTETTRKFLGILERHEAEIRARLKELAA